MFPLESAEMDDVYVSCIKINGRPILPPLVKDEGRKAELRGYRDLALQIELKIKERYNHSEDPLESTFPLSPVPTESTEVTIDLDSSSEANASLGRLVRSASYTVDTPSQALLDSIVESESETSTIKESRKLSGIPKYTCGRKKSVKVATIFSPKRKRPPSGAGKKGKASVQTEDEEVQTVIEANLMEDLIKSMQEEHELKLQMLAQKHEEEKAKLREEYLGQQHVMFQHLAVTDPVRPQSPPIKQEKSPSVVVSKGLHELTNKMSTLPLGALVRGYFVRRLHKTERVENIKCAIKETLCIAVNLHEQPPPLSMADIELHGRLIQQLDQSLKELHSIFFEMSLVDRLKIIAADRVKLSRAGYMSSRSSSSGRVSMATEKRQEMRRRSHQENLTPRGRLDSKGQKALKKLSKSPRSILTESSGFDDGNLRQNKNQIPWR